MAHTLKNIKVIFLAVLLINLFVLIINLTRKLFPAEEKMQSIYSLKQFLNEYDYCKKMIRNQFNKNLIMSAKEERFQSGNSCWICDKLFGIGDDKVRDDCHITGKYYLSINN